MSDAERATTALIELMAKLRDPQTGCPWDQKQTFATVAPYTIEEAYEVADAIERDDLPLLRSGQTLIGLGEPLTSVKESADLAATGVSYFAAELIPRICLSPSSPVVVLPVPARAVTMICGSLGRGPFDFFIFAICWPNPD